MPQDMFVNTYEGIAFAQNCSDSVCACLHILMGWIPRAFDFTQKTAMPLTWCCSLCLLRYAQTFLSRCICCTIADHPGCTKHHKGSPRLSDEN